MAISAYNRQICETISMMLCQICDRNSMVTLRKVLTQFSIKPEEVERAYFALQMSCRFQYALLLSFYRTPITFLSFMQICEYPSFSKLLFVFCCIVFWQCYRWEYIHRVTNR